ncbi:MAG: hypothetical protein ACLFR1_15970 [Spirochaetia bacterium]
MIISKTPLRIPFAGGLTDLKRYAEQYGGTTVSATIDKYIYCGIKTNVDGYINLKYMDVHEKISSIRDVRNPLIRETLRLTKLDQTPVDVYIMADLNSESGLGSSGALTIGLLHAMHRFKGEEVDKQQLIEEASHIEIDVLDSASGFHDPSICALGGLRLLEYDGKTVTGREVGMSDVQLQIFQNRLMFFYSGRHFKTKPSLDILNNRMDEALDTLAEIKSVAYDIEKALVGGDFINVGECIQKQQTLKQNLPGKFSDEYVEQTMKKLNELGAYAQIPGGKIGAFIMVYCPENHQNKIRKEFADLNEIKIKLSQEGTIVTSL